MAIKNYLIEGVSGSGKTSVCRELINRGYDAVNGDNELAYNGNPDSGEPSEERGHDTWIWDEKKVRELVADKSKDKLFFCGGSRNFQKFIDCFDLVFVLETDDETIKHRLQTRPGDKWGKTQEQLAMVLRLNQSKADIPKDGITIDASQPLDKVTDKILEYVSRDS